MSQDDQQYLPNQLPARITRKLYVCYGVSGWGQGRISIWDADMSSQDKCLLTTHNVTIKIPQEVDFKEKIIEALKNEKNRVLAEAHMKAEELQTKINELLCIEYKPQKTADSNVIPF